MYHLVGRLFSILVAAFSMRVNSASERIGGVIRDMTSLVVSVVAFAVTIILSSGRAVIANAKQFSAMLNFQQL